MNLAQLIEAFKASGLIRRESLSAMGDANEQIKAAVTGAASEFSRYSPVVSKLEFPASASAVTLTGWYEDSRIVAVESPTGDVPPTLLGPDDYYANAYDGTITLIDIPVGQTVRARYTTLHTVSGTGNVTIPASRLRAFYYLAGAYLCESLAARHAEEHKANIADITDHSSKSREFLALAKEYRKQFLTAVNASEPSGVRPAEASSAYETPSHGVLR